MRWRILDRWISRGMPGDLEGTVLKTDLYDEASGPHHHLGAAASQVDRIGIDVDRDVARLAHNRLLREGNGVRVVICDVRALPFGTGSLAAVLSLSTLDHFEASHSIFDSLRELKRTLMPGGRLLLTLDNPSNPEVILRARLPPGIVSRLRADDFALGKTLNARQAERMFRELDLKVERRDYLLHGPRFVAIRVLDRLRRCDKPSWSRRVARLLEAFEALSRWPLRQVTAHYVAWRLRRPETAGTGEGQREVPRHAA